MAPEGTEPRGEEGSGGERKLVEDEDEEEDRRWCSGARTFLDSQPGSDVQEAGERAPSHGARNSEVYFGHLYRQRGA